MSETTTLTLTDFLLARIAEDEDGAREELAMPSGSTVLAREWRVLMARILRECEAKRRIAEYRISEGYADDGMVTALRALAAVYADHPDYRDEWRPENDERPA